MTIVVTGEIVDAIRKHALSVADGMEIGGRLVVRETDGRVVAYVPVRNIATEPRRFRLGSSWPPVPGHRSIVLHSHPIGDASPSRADLNWARERAHRSTFAIWSIPRDALRVWTVFGEDSYRRVPVDVVEKSL